MNTSKSIPDTGFLRLAQVLTFYPVKRSTWYAGIKSGRYPRAHKLGPRASAWRAEDIRELIEQASSNPERRVA